MTTGKIAIDVYAAETVHTPYHTLCRVVLCGESGRLGRLGFDRRVLDNGLRALNRETGQGGVGFMPWTERGSTVGTMSLNWGRNGVDTYKPVKVGGIMAWQ